MLLMAPMAIDDAARALCADVREALQQSGLTIDGAAYVMRVPRTKLSEQLHGHRPFTFFWRTFALGPEFRIALVRVWGKRFGCEVLASKDFVRLIGAVETLNKRMAKADLPSVEERKQA